MAKRSTKISSHEQILQGGELVFRMQTTPNKQWGSAKRRGRPLRPNMNLIDRAKRFRRALLFPNARPLPTQLNGADCLRSGSD